MPICFSFITIYSSYYYYPIQKQHVFLFFHYGFTILNKSTDVNQSACMLIFLFLGYYGKYQFPTNFDKLGSHPIESHRNATSHFSGILLGDLNSVQNGLQTNIV